MKDGEIIDQGHFDEVASRNADMFADWSITKNVTSESDTVSEYDDDEERRTRKRQMIQRSITGSEKRKGEGRNWKFRQNIEAARTGAREQLDQI